MQVEYYIKESWGNTHMYIKDRKIASVVSKLTGRKTVFPSDIDALKELGLTFIEVLRPRNQ